MGTGRLRPAPTVLAYHAVGDVPAAQDVHALFTPVEAFRRQMERLAGRVVPLDDVVSGRATSPRSVAITFDDGYRSVLEQAVPVLRRLGLPATVFVPSAHIGDANRWDPPTGLDLGIMDVDELRACEAAGVRVESHGHAHLDMRDAGGEQVREDLTRSRELLGDAVGRAPELLAWPYRTGSRTAQQVAAEVGFRASFSIDLPEEGPQARGRVQITPGDGDALFALKTSGRYLQLRHHPVLAAGYRRLVRPLRRAA